MSFRQSALLARNCMLCGCLLADTSANPIGTVSCYTCSSSSTIFILHRVARYITYVAGVPNAMQFVHHMFTLRANILGKPFAFGWDVLFLFMKALIATRIEWMMHLVSGPSHSVCIQWMYTWDISATIHWWECAQRRYVMTKQTTTIWVWVKHPTYAIKLI